MTVAKRGAITSLVDKPSGRELVRPIDGRAVNDLGPGDGTPEVENFGPVSVTPRTDSPTPLKHTSRITLYRDSRRIDLHNEIQENFSSPHTWSFAFKVDAPEIWHEEVGAVIRAKLLGDGGHYSPRNARYDWLTLNHVSFRFIIERTVKWLRCGSSRRQAVSRDADCAVVPLRRSGRLK